MSQEAVLPSHLGIILDGNRRWAKARDLSTFEGHLKGYENFKDITKHAFNRGVDYVSAYIFSTENWARTKDEVKFLMSLALKLLTKDLAELNRENIRVVWLGSKEKLSQKLIDAILKAEEKTKNNTHGTLCLCFNYGGKQEIVEAVKKIITEKTPVDQVTSDLIDKSLYAPEVPPVDLIIRTSGEHRSSGFMLFRSDYAEFYFTNKLWPDFTRVDLEDALNDYSYRSRRFGK